MNSDAKEAIAPTFSWKRVLSLAHYLAPALRKQLIICAVSATVLSLLYVFFTYAEASRIAFTCYSVIGLMFIMAPLGLGKADYRFTVAQLPVSAGEKLAFLLIYFWAVLMLVINVVPVVILSLFSISPETVMGSYVPFGDEPAMLSVLGATSYLISMVLQLFVLYTMVTAKGNRALRAVVGLIILYVVFMFAVFVLSVIHTAYELAKLPAGVNPTDLPADPQFMSHTLVGVFIVVAALFVVFGAVLLVKLYKRLKHSGF